MLLHMVGALVIVFFGCTIEVAALLKLASQLGDCFLPAVLVHD